MVYSKSAIFIGAAIQEREKHAVYHALVSVMQTSPMTCNVLNAFSTNINGKYCDHGHCFLAHFTLFVTAVLIDCKETF